MNIVIFFVLLICLISIGGAVGAFIGRWIGKKYLARKETLLVKKDALKWLAEERNAYRFALENDISLEVIEGVIRRTKEARS